MFFLFSRRCPVFCLFQILVFWVWFCLFVCLRNKLFFISNWSPDRSLHQWIQSCSFCLDWWISWISCISFLDIATSKSQLALERVFVFVFFSSFVSQAFQSHEKFCLLLSNFWCAIFLMLLLRISSCLCLFQFLWKRRSVFMSLLLFSICTCWHTISLIARQYTWAWNGFNMFWCSSIFRGIRGLHHIRSCHQSCWRQTVRHQSQQWVKILVP